MQPGTQKLLRFLKSWAINTLAVLVAVHHPCAITSVPRQWAENLPPLIASLVLGILNAFVRPILMLIALPLLIFTLGLFTLVINALLLCFVSWLMHAVFSGGFVSARRFWGRSSSASYFDRAESFDRQRARLRATQIQAAKRFGWGGGPPKNSDDDEFQMAGDVYSQLEIRHSRF